MTVDEIRSEALALSQTERAALVRDLLMSLETEEFDPGSESAWAAEIMERAAAVERGDYTASGWKESLARVRKTLRERRPE